MVRISNRSIRELEFMSRIGQNYSGIRIHGENRTKVFENQNSWRELNRSIRELEFVSRIGQNYSKIRIQVENTEQKYSRIRIHGENIEQNYSRIRIHGENRTKRNYSRIRIHGENRRKVFENQNSWRELNRSIRELEFMSRFGQNYSRIRILKMPHVLLD